MKTRNWLVIAGMMIAVALLLALVPVTLAQGPLDNAGQGTFGPGYGMGPGGGGRGAGLGLGGPENSLVAVAAEQLGLEPAQVIAELQAGKTLAEVITAHNGSPEQVVEVFVTSRQAQLAELVASGQITQEQADSMLVTIRENATARLNQAGLGRGDGQGFVDEDGDGVCDHAGSGPQGGRGMGRRGQ